jgi:hypothetical protein
MEQYDLSVDIFHRDEESLGSAMDFLVPAEVWNYGQVDPKKRACDWLHLSL